MCFPLVVLRALRGFVEYSLTRLVFGAQVGASQVRVHDVGEKELAFGTDFKFVVKVREGISCGKEYFHCILIIERIIALIIGGDYFIIKTPPINMEVFLIMADMSAGLASLMFRLSTHSIEERLESGRGMGSADRDINSDALRCS